MAIIIKFDTAKITEQIEGTLDDKAKLFFYNEFYRYMEKYVPADTLSMYDTVDISSDGIFFLMPYSSQPYYGKTKEGNPMHFKTDKHPLATDHWDIATWNAKGDEICRNLQDFINRRNRNG